ncbi:MAG: flagellar hook protein FlgE [Bacillota bacterium]
MMRSLFSAVSGLRAHQTRMDVIGNNVANVNTPGYKSSRVTFQEVFSQTLRGASSPSDMSMTERGGMNPLQVGLGVTTGSIDTNHVSGNLQPTSRMADVAIEGKGFFVVQDGSTHAYTRVGAFDTDGDGILVDSEGRKVLGWVLDPLTGNLPTDKTETLLNPIRIAIGSNMSASATNRIVWQKNLDSQAALGATKTVPVTTYDSQGAPHSVTLTFTKIGPDAGPPVVPPNTWAWEATTAEADLTIPAGTEGVLTFNADGSFSATNPAISAIPMTHPGVSNMNVVMNFAGMTQVAGPSTADTASVNGHPTGTLESYTFDSKGIISGFFSNGQTKILGQISVANFANPSGLQKKGKSLYVESNNSGDADIGEAGMSGRGTVAPSSLEMSNVDLAEEFTQMIITQRGFQANSRIITVSDELLQELVSLKR